MTLPNKVRKRGHARAEEGTAQGREPAKRSLAPDPRPGKLTERTLWEGVSLRTVGGDKSRR